MPLITVTRWSSKPSRRQAGISLVETMVGLVLGMLIVAGASSFFLVNLVSAQRLQIEARLNQDLRAAMDMVTRDLRRGGYWANATGSTLTANPYATITLGSNPTQIAFAYSRDNNNTLGGDEQYGFRLNTDAAGEISVDFLSDSAWQSVTDTRTMRLDLANSNIERLSIMDTSTPPVPTSVDQPIALNNACPNGCATTCQVTARAYRITLTGISKTDSGVTRTLTSTVRVRNDVIAGSCNP